jgi:cell wall-associated NlpC family hydrolase
MAALTLSCASTRPAPPRPEELDKGRRIAESATTLVGTPYRYGGDTPAGFDCSGLIRYVYGRFGYDLPRATGDQIKVGRRVDLEDFLPGDLVFFKVGFWKSLHAGIYIGDGRFVHAPKSGSQVEVQRLDRGYYQDRYHTARRVIGGF